MSPTMSNPDYDDLDKEGQKHWNRAQELRNTTAYHDAVHHHPDLHKKKDDEYHEKKDNIRRKQLNGWNSVDLEIDQKKKIRRYEALIKKLEFEAKVQKEVIEIRTNQLHDAESRIIQLENVLKENHIIGTHNSTSVPKTITTQQEQQQYEEEDERAVPQSSQGGNNSKTSNIGETGLRNLLHVSQIKLQEQEKERKLDQSEVLELRNQVSSYIAKVEEIEHENLTLKQKVQELTTLLKLQRLSEDNGHDVYKELHTKTNLVVDLRSKNDLLSKQIVKLDVQVNKLSLESTNYKNMILELNNILSPNVNTSEVQNIIDTIKRGEQISKEHAQLLTIQHLKSQVETLEDEKMSLTNEINTLVYELQNMEQQQQQQHAAQGQLQQNANGGEAVTTGTSIRSSITNFMKKL